MSPPRPMPAKLVAEIPPGLFYEPKWDGFRALVVRDGDGIEIHRRNGKPMARYFPTSSPPWARACRRAACSTARSS